MIRVRVPGDKSISHRAALLAPMASSGSAIGGLSTGRDVRTSIQVMRRLGVDIDCEEQDGALAIRCAGGGLAARAPQRLDCGNSGTTARLLAGILVGAKAGATLDGDESLRGRPMRRVVYPLQAMGGTIEYLDEHGRLPLRIQRRATGALRPLRHRPRIASAQVKSAILLAGALARVRVGVSEPVRSRDHTERMLAAMGAPVAFESGRTSSSGTRDISFDPSGWDGRLKGLRMTVPGDPSSAAFLMGAALLAGKAARIDAVSANPGRTGFLAVLEEMGAVIEREPSANSGGEPVESWTVRPGNELRAFSVGGSAIPGVIDEIPILAVLAARAHGRSEIRDAAELRVKESDRLAALARTLDALGADVREHASGLTITGRREPLRGIVETRGDHRIAMAFGVLDVAGGADLAIDDRQCAAISFPGFWRALEPFARPSGGGDSGT